MRTEVALWSRGKQTQSIPVEIRAETTVVAAAAGRAAPDFVFANANDNAYGLVMLDDRSAAWLGAHIGEVPDTFLRAMLWGAMWDLVRDARLAPTAVHCHGTAGASRRAGRTDRVGHRLASEPSDVELSLRRASKRTSSRGSRTLLLAGASSAQRGYGPRKNQLDAYISLARTTAAMTRLAAWLDSGSTAGLPLRQPTRWSIVTHLIERGTPNADALFAAETRHDTTANGKRSAFVAAAGRSSAADESPILRSIFSRHDAQRGLGHGEPPRVQHGRSSGADAALSRTGARQPAVDSEESPNLLSRVVARRLHRRTQIAGSAVRDR